MLELKNIVKEYSSGDTKVTALKGVSIQFRTSEFVSILGQSGCGKTTLLNIIGGLDRYTSGDLVINGKSTKDYKDRDFDAYRNYSIGFVFQSYNLIPHQTVLQNVELALTLSGVSKKERRIRAKEALEKVGLGNQLKKRPSEMSGGQMQRVAIARAIVNNPDIILADEPTGALDSETSVQVMDILKEISKDRLIIMVTHNPELAEKYATRTITMLDGEIKGDTAPLSESELRAERQKDLDSLANSKKRIKRPSMSLATSFGLSLKNLFTKKGRTSLTAFAGSIGIIGIALIYAVSQGTTNYIDLVQEDTLSSYPITLESSTVDLSSFLETYINSAQANRDHDNDAVYEKSMIYDMVNAMASLTENKNDLAAFKEHLEKEMADEESKTGLNETVSGVHYSYDLNLLVYTKNKEGEIMISDTAELTARMFKKLYGLDMSGAGSSSGFGGSSSPIASLMNRGGSSSSRTWQEMLKGNDGALVNPILQKQYNVVYGEWPQAYNEVVIVVDENNEIDEMTLYAMGLKSDKDVDEIADAALNGNTVENTKLEKWSYEDICGLKFKVVLNASAYSYDESTGTYIDLRDSETGRQYLYNNGTELKVVGIIKPNENAVSSMLNGSIAYTYKLTEYVINEVANTMPVKAQLQDKTVDIFTGLPFKVSDGSVSNDDKAEYFKNYLEGLSDDEKVNLYIDIMSTPTDAQIEEMVNKTMANLDRAAMEQMIMSSAEKENYSEEVVKYLLSLSDDELKDVFKKMIAEQAKANYINQVKAQLAGLPKTQILELLKAMINMADIDALAGFYDISVKFSTASYDENMQKLGVIDLDTPKSISLYAHSFEDKESIEAAIKEYNESVDDAHKISYTDYVGLMMSSITTIINAITYVLIAFVAVSLIVSSIMIGVITLISVQERTKEIGILRAIGASKKNVSSMFNAETVIIGFGSGLIGVGFTYLACIPINIVLHVLTKINSLSAVLPWYVAIILILISVLLTLIAGIIPSRSAATKDPVVALRTE